MKLQSNKIIVTNYGDNSLSIINKEDMSEVTTIDLKGMISGTTGATRSILEGEHNLLILNSDKDTLYKVDMEELKLLNEVSLGRCPIRIKAFGNKIYVVNIDSNSLSIIDRNSLDIIESIYVGEKPTDFVIDERSGKVYITNLNSHSISIIDYENGSIEEIKLTFMPFRIKVESGVIYVLGFANNHSLRNSILYSLDIELNKPIWTKIIDGIYFDFIKANEMNCFYMVDSENSWLYKFDYRADRNQKKLYVGGLTNFLNYDLNYLYLNDMVNNQIILINIDENQIKKRITVGKEPHDILLT